MTLMVIKRIIIVLIMPIVSVGLIMEMRTAAGNGRRERKEQKQTSKEKTGSHSEIFR